MATFREISEDYSRRIRSSISESSFAKSGSLMKESERQQEKRRRIFAVLKEINVDLMRYTIDNKPLSDEQKHQILKVAAEILGLKRPDTLVIMVKEASNDNFVALANYWATFFAEIKL